MAGQSQAVTNREVFLGVKNMLEEFVRSAESAFAPILLAMEEARAHARDIDALTSEFRGRLIDESEVAKIRMQLDNLKKYFPGIKENEDDKFLKIVKDTVEEFEKLVNEQRDLVNCLELIEGFRSAPSDEESRGHEPTNLPNALSRDLSDAASALAETANEQNIAAEQLRQAAVAVRDMVEQMTSGAGHGIVTVDAPSESVIGAALEFREFTEGITSSAEEMDNLRIVARNSLGEIDRLAEKTFRRLETFVKRALETGKFEWRDLARVAVGALREILEEQIKPRGSARDRPSVAWVAHWARCSAPRSGLPFRVRRRTKCCRQRRPGFSISSAIRSLSTAVA